MDRIVNGQRIVKCDKCIDEGKTSKVYASAGQRTLIGITAFYDETGYLHVHDPNTVNERFLCSNGHAWSVRRRVQPCPQTIGCTWGSDFKPTITWEEDKPR